MYLISFGAGCGSEEVIGVTLGDAKSIDVAKRSRELCAAARLECAADPEVAPDGVVQLDLACALPIHLRYCV